MDYVLSEPSMTRPSWVALYGMTHSFIEGFPGDSEVKESASNAGNLGSIPGLGRSSGEGNEYPLQYSGLENSTDRGAW